ncbi:hypothetical protein AB0I60_01530 [Actinosynnema sp. NPDC050436]|uniref:hypothetical protein n=1 Tax=Actinosynnema sp. NPDC050436 TaxID=3155659 RepID=UPI0034045924
MTIISRPWPGPRERLDRALADGPFHHALSLAIDRSGLGLARLKHRLDGAGVPVSVTTLSNWRCGRTAPARGGSRRAVGVLEAVLGLPAGSLTALLDHAGPRHADLPRRVVGEERLWGSHSGVLPLLASLTGTQELPLVVVDLRESVEVDADRLQRRHRVREVVRATADDAHKRVVPTRGGPGRAPRLAATRYCAPGRVETLPDQGFTIMELLLPRPLARGETAIVEYEYDYTGDEPDTTTNRLFRYPLRTHLLEIRFAPDAQPLSCHSYQLASRTGPEREVTDLAFAPGIPAHVFATDVAPGIRGVRWEWP